MAISYTVSFVFAPNTVISSSNMNTNFSDNANTWTGLEALTKTFSNLQIDTVLRSAGTVQAANGTAAAPSLTFTNSATAGFYRKGSNNIGIATSGTIAMEFDSSHEAIFYGHIIFSPTTLGILGTTTNDSAASGVVGEYTESVVGLTSAPTSAQWGDVTNVQLTAGDWDVTVVNSGAFNGATVTRVIIGIGKTTGNVAPDITGNGGDDSIDCPVPTSPSLPCGTITRRVTLTTTTVIYFKGFASYSVAIPQFRGRISARRVR